MRINNVLSADLVSTGDGRLKFMISQFLSLLKYPFLRNILIAFLAVAALLPIYEQYRAFPPFLNMVTSAAEDQALRIASHLSAYDFFKNSSLDHPDAIPGDWVDEVTMVSRDLKLEKERRGDFFH